jgi:hypothetical protein
MGALDKVTPERLRSLLPDHRNYADVIFVSACYSENIGQVFLDAGFPCVICVHSSCEILDDAAMLFASRFYHGIMLGRTIGDSFE